MSHNRPLGFCFFGTFSPSRRQMPGSPRIGLRPRGGDAFDSVLAYLPAGPLKQRRDPAIPIAAILAGKSNDGLSQSIFVFTLCRPVALRASGLPQQKARMPLTDSMLAGMADRTAPSFRA